mmetsp:Transcript_9311/g.14246  ORF Transcript_9311/g.14246 Transcript_9311/m.14246 type:complete len:314 (-) Transcript_9311:145-1086(-)
MRCSWSGCPCHQHHLQLRKKSMQYWPLAFFTHMYLRTLSINPFCLTPSSPGIKGMTAFMTRSITFFMQGFSQNVVTLIMLSRLARSVMESIPPGSSAHHLSPTFAHIASYMPVIMAPIAAPFIPAPNPPSVDISMDENILPIIITLQGLHMRSTCAFVGRSVGISVIELPMLLMEFIRANKQYSPLNLKHIFSNVGSMDAKTPPPVQLESDANLSSADLTVVKQFPVQTPSIFCLKTVGSMEHIPPTASHLQSPVHALSALFSHCMIPNSRRPRQSSVVITEVSSFSAAHSWGANLLGSAAFSQNALMCRRAC